MHRIFNILGGRKLLVVSLFTILGVVLQYAGKFDSNMTTLFLGLAGVFAAGNSVEHIAGRFVQNKKNLSRSSQNSEDE